PVDCAPAGDDAVSGNLVFLHAEFVAAMFDEHVELFETAFVQQEIDALAGGELALGVLRCMALFASARARRGALGFKGGDHVFHLPCYALGMTKVAGSRKRDFGS